MLHINYISIKIFLKTQIKKISIVFFEALWIFCAPNMHGNKISTYTSVFLLKFHTYYLRKIITNFFFECSPDVSFSGRMFNSEHRRFSAIVLWRLLWLQNSGHIWKSWSFYSQASSGSSGLVLLQLRLGREADQRWERAKKKTLAPSALFQLLMLPLHLIRKLQHKYERELPCSQVKSAGSSECLRFEMSTPTFEIFLVFHPSGIPCSIL